jgi:recombinational DNA repair ATPase RecF
VLEDEEVDAVMLLDDVDVELDPERLARLWAILDPRRQVLVTSARPAVWLDLEIDQTWTVTSGRVETAC